MYVVVGFIVTCFFFAASPMRRSWSEETYEGGHWQDARCVNQRRIVAEIRTWSSRTHMKDAVGVCEGHHIKMLTSLRAAGYA
jgi:hypothetical protein